MKILLIILLSISLFNIPVNATANPVIIKANMVKGSNFYTVEASPARIEQVVEQILIRRKFEVVKEFEGKENLLYIDLFVFQYLNDHPTITMTVRSKKGIHHFDQERIKNYPSRVQANFELANLLARRMPALIDTNKIYEPTVSDLLSNKKVTIYTKPIAVNKNPPKTTHLSLIRYPDQDFPEFIIPEGMITYLLFCSDSRILNKNDKDEPILLDLRINKAGRFELVKINTRVNLDEKQKQQIKNLIDAFPLWIVEKEIEGIELILAIK